MLTRSEPVYYVTSGPTHGVLRNGDDVTRGDRKSRDASPRRGGRRDRKRKTQQHRRPPKYVSEAVLNFTHDDVARGHVVYSLLPAAGTGSSSAVLEDSFTFVLTARNAQPVRDSVTVQVVPADYDGVMRPSPTMMSSSTGAPEVVKPASTSDDDGGADKILIVVIVAVLTLLAIFGLIVFTCVRRRRRAKRKKLELAAVIDGSGTAHQVTSSDQHGADDGRGPAVRPQAPARRGVPPPPSLPIIVEPSSTDSNGERSPTESNAAVVIPNSPPASDSGASRTGYVRVLPPSPPSSLSGAGLQRNGTPAAPPGGDRLQHGGLPAPGSVWKEQVTFDWEHVDPELLQHCRKTNPVLHKNQYWV